MTFKEEAAQFVTCPACGRPRLPNGYIGTLAGCMCLKSTAGGTVWYQLPRPEPTPQQDIIARLERLEQLLSTPRCVETIQVVNVPSGGYLILTVDPGTLDTELVRIREEAQRYFAGHKVVVSRAGDVRWGVIAFEDPHAND